MFPGAAGSLPTEMLPEVNIAWSVTAMLRIKRERVERCRQGAPAGAAASGNGCRPVAASGNERRSSAAAPGLGLATGARDGWIRALTEETLASIPDVHAAHSMAELLEHAPAISPSYLSLRSGLRRAATVVAVQGFGGVIPRKLLREARAKVRERARRRDRH